MFSRFGLQAKIMILSLSLGMAVVGVLIAIGFVNYNAEYQSTAASFAKELNQSVQNQMNKKLDIGITGAVSFAANRELINAVKQGDKALAQEILSGISQTFKEHTNFKNIKVHIHTPQNHSFLRSWKKKNGDDLSSFRFGVQKVIDEKHPIQVLELGRAGLAVRGIAPLFDGSSYIGSLEFIQGVASVHKAFKKQGKHYLMLLNDSALEISTKAKGNPKVGQYYLASKKWFSPESVKFAQQLDWSELMSKGWLIQGEYLITYAKVDDMRGKEVGIQLIAEPVERLDQALAVLASNIKTQVFTIIAIVALMILMMLFSINTMVIRPVKALQGVFSSVIKQGDFSQRVPTSQNQNEVNLMSQDFNQLLNMLQQNIQSISATMAAIEKGDLSKRVDTDAVGELDTLKQSVNQTAENLDQTMTELGRVLNEISLSNFSTEVKQVNAHGAFKSALEQTESAMHTLRDAIQDINSVVNHMAQANFSHLVEAEVSGDLLILKDNINRTLHSINDGFDSFSNSLSSLSSGDLTTKVIGDYHGQLAKLQDIINNSLSNIASMFTEVKLTSRGALDNVQHVTKGNVDLNSRTQNQAASIEETAASMEEITSTVQSSVTNAKQANDLAKHARTDAQEGAAIMSDAKQAMHGIHEASAKISEITTLIDGIAFQTNLLALNAAVEAARAGDHGRGFAVVAGEVRNLAQKSADAAKDISGLIADTTEQIDRGTELAERSSDMLDQINQRVTAVSDMVEEITTAAEEQSIGMSQINQAISQMDQITQQNAALVEEIARDTENMNQQVSHVVNLTESFSVDEKALSLTTSIQTGDFSFAQARRAHRGWRSHMSGLLHTASTDVDQDQAVDSHSCDLGQWLDTDAQIYAHMPEYQSLLAVHDSLHIEIRRLIDIAGAEEDIPDQEIKKVEAISEDVINHINALENAVARMKG